MIATASGPRVRSAAMPWTARVRFRRERAWLLMLLTRQMAVMLRAGVPLSAALASLGAQVGDETFAVLLRDLRRDVVSGLSLCGAMARRGHVFGVALVNVVRAGEESGQLPEMLDRASRLLEQEHDMRCKVAAALLYPAAILLVAMVAAAGMTQWVFPAFVASLGDGAALPWPTRLLTAATACAANPLTWLAALAATAAAAFRLSRELAAEGGRLRMEERLLRVPLVGDTVRKILLSRLCMHAATLVDCGLPLAQAMRLAADATGSEAVRHRVELLCRDLERGFTVRECIVPDPFFPPVTAMVIGVAEATGSYGRAMRTLSRLFEADADGRLRTAITLLEPAAIVAVGAVVGFILVAFFWPLLQLTTLS